MKVGFIGCGNMGGALARAAAAAGAEVLLYDRDEAKCKALADEVGGKCPALAETVKDSEVIFIGVKPVGVADVAREMGEIPKRTVLVSMAAGVSLERLNALFGRHAIIRIMPNTPVAVGEGMIVYSPNGHVDEEQESLFLLAMAKAGELYRIHEEKIDAATAVSGCGPAFVYMFIDALIKGGVAAGLGEDEAKRLACRTLSGAAEMVRSVPKTPEELRIAVCSPGGSTIEGVKRLMGADFEAIVASAVDAAFKRTCELGK